MPISYLEYELFDSYIVNWLAAGPQILPVAGSTGDETQAQTRDQIAARFYEKKSQIARSPVERGPLKEGVFSIGAYQGEWNYYACAEDRLVNHSRTLEQCSFARSWAYCELISDQQQSANCVISAYGPVDIWINKKPVYHLENFSERLESFEFPARLEKGTNRVLVRFANLTAGACPLAMALRIPNVAGVRVRIPTLIPALARRNQLEQIFQRIALKRDVYAEKQPIELIWPDDMVEAVPCDVRLQTPSGRIYGQTEDAGKPGDRKIMGMPITLMDGAYQIYLMPRAWEMYESNIRVTKTLELQVLGRARFSAQPYGTPEERRREALQQAAQQENNLFAEIAKMAQGRWDAVENSVLANAIEQVQRFEDGSDLLLLGLLGALARFGAEEGFQSAWKEQIEACARSYAYAQNSTPCSAFLLTQPDRQIVPLACAILAGQLFPEQTFAGGQTGLALRAGAEQAALEWIRARGMHGYAAWDSKATYAVTLAALAHLIDLAQLEELWELAALLMDQILFSIALFAHGGVFGAPQAVGSTASCKAGLLDETSGITRLLWGMGVYNHHIAGTVSMACLKNYPLPEMIAQISAGRPTNQWSRQRHQQDGAAADIVAYRTADYLLASTQDYQPGQPGSREHLWQATLGPQCVVYTTHPGSAGQDDAQAPNFWLGNGVLPRIAQWQDSLVAIYNAPDDAWMDFTHAYCPTADFDETVLDADVFYGRLGDGYIALRSMNGLRWIGEGRSAFRELRAPGRQNIWLCRMGQAAVDGVFSDFIAREKSLSPIFDGLNVKLPTLRGEELRFGWDQPLLVNGQEQPLHGFPRFETPYGTTSIGSTVMEIRNEDYLLRWNFGPTPEE